MLYAINIYVEYQILIFAKNFSLIILDEGKELNLATFAFASYDSSFSQNCILSSLLATTQVLPNLFLSSECLLATLIWIQKIMSSCYKEQKTVVFQNYYFAQLNFLDIWISFFDKYFETNCKKLWYCSFWLLDAAEFWFIASVPREILLFIQYLWDFYSCQMPKSIWQ